MTNCDRCDEPLLKSNHKGRPRIHCAFCAIAVNKERANINARRFRLKNPSVVRENYRKYRRENLEKERARDRKKYNDDPEVIKKRIERNTPEAIRKRIERQDGIARRRIERYNNDPAVIRKREERRMKNVVKQASSGLRQLERSRIRKEAWIKNLQRRNLLERIRERIRQVLKGNRKSAGTLELLGCSASEAWAHLEKQFKPGMTRANHGPIWHIDHIRPCASFDLSQPEQQRQCFHFTNLQPLFALDNLRKGARYDEKS